MVIAHVKEENATSPALGQGEPKGGKRRCVQSACIPCRKRKSKCDGGTPECATCTAVYKTSCFYDAEGGRPKPTATPTSTAQKRDHASLASDSNSELLIGLVRTLPESDAYELFSQIRKDHPLDLASLAESWRTVTLPPSTSSAGLSLEGELSLLLGKPATTQTGESRHYGHTSSLGLVPEDENYTCSRITPVPEEHKNGTWSTVTQDIYFVNRLLELYFLWSHPFYVVFSHEAFYQDFRSGRHKYCSPLLVNAILAYACHFSDESQARVDPDDPRTAGDHFFAEARRLLFENEEPSLTTTQALCVMALREPSAGRDSSGFMYMGRCMRMCVELGLHLKDSIPPNLTESEIEVRKVTFWGCFVVDTAWSVCIGRITQLPRAAITLDKPMLLEPNHAGYYDKSGQSINGQVTTRLFIQESSVLAGLVNDNNFMFFAPRDRFTDRRLLQTHRNYQNWYQNLPSVLHLPDNVHVRPQPHILILHMYYHTIILHLFRPLLKVNLIHHNVTPRQMCIDCANKVSDLLRHYRLHYNLRACQLVLTHILLSVCIVHLLYSKESQTNADNLLEGLQALEEVSTCHYFGTRAFRIIHALAKTWSLRWPDALKNSPLIPKDDMSVVSPSVEGNAAGYPTRSSKSVSTNGYSAMTPRDISVRRESLSMFAQPHNGQHGHASQTQGHQVSMIGLHNPNAPLPFPSSTAPNMPHATADQQLFWTPIQGMGVPLVPRTYQHLSPMDLNSVLGNDDEWERMNRDGFKMSETWIQEPMDFNGNIHQSTSNIPPGHDASASIGNDGWWSNDGAGPTMMG
ncbi:fungal-specific transcription factor domain-domain-containing protein [Clohesyomyces aquaticus]|uniref:Fungal-specific transcription factor domain-domain-containing protein n=1 Tax=Clohesyomyces aquaticus TaxID=1231657 RepID=A0A1Y1ZFB6_9PLEO|nr:fungal-specific transcription factor domain-domain-containing protein [Clohesyomyces aquaticus]